MNKTTIALAIALMSGLTTSAFAAGFQSLDQSASGLGNAYAGSAAVADNASTLYFNPAGMTRLKPFEFSLGAIVINAENNFSDHGSATGSLYGNGGNASGWSSLPNFSGSVGVTDKLFFGLSVNRPFALNTHYASPFVGEAQGDQLTIKSWNINPSVAYKVTDKVSFGAGLNWQRMDMEQGRLLGVGATSLPSCPAFSRCTLPFPVQNYFASYSGDSDAWGWNLGTLVDISDTMRMGLAYRSSMTHKFSGTNTISRVDGLLVSDAFTGSGSGSATLKTPDTATLSIAQNLGDWESYGDLTWTGWNRTKSLRVQSSSNAFDTPSSDTHFRNTWRVALGATYTYNEQWKFKYGVAYEQSPVTGPATRTVLIPEGDKWWFTVGAQWMPIPGSRFDLGLAYLHSQDRSIRNDQSASSQGFVVGDYRNHTYKVGLQYSQSF